MSYSNYARLVYVAQLSAQTPRMGICTLQYFCKYFCILDLAQTRAFIKCNILHISFNNSFSHLLQNNWFVQ